MCRLKFKSCPFRAGKSRGLLKKTFLGVAIGVPVVVGLQYSVSEPRERRRLNILIEGVGRFCRFVSSSYYIPRMGKMYHIFLYSQLITWVSVFTGLFMLDSPSH